MLKGDLGATPLSDVLTSLAADSVTGCLHIADDSGDEALVYFRDGQVYAAYVPGRRPHLGARLISSGALAPEALAEALDAQENELQGWRLGELLVHLGYVERPVVEAFTLEQLRESCFDLSRWPAGRFRFRKNEKTRADVALHASVADLLAEVERRRAQWEAMSGVVHGPGAVPVLSTGGLAAAEMTLDQDQWALLCKVDGERDVAQLARDCGFTSFEAGQIVYSLVGAGLLDVEESLGVEDDAEPEPDLRSAVSAIASMLGGSAEAAERTEVADPVEEEPAGMSRFAEAFADPGEADAASELSRLLGTMSEPEPEPEPAVEDVPETVAEEPAAPEAVGPLHDDLSSELASLTAALADLPSLSLPPTLEPDFPAMPAELPVAEVAPVAPEPVAEVAPVAPEPVAEAAPEDPFGDSLARVSEALNALLGDSLPPVAMPEAPRAPEPTAEEIEAARAEAERIERSRAAAAAELAEAHALAEASRAQKGGLRFGRRRDKAPAETTEREDAERAEAEEAARQEAERAAAEAAARAEAERLDRERAAAEEAARAAIERLAAEEASRAEAERLAAEEAARAEAERLAAEEAARLEAEHAAAEEAARLEAERLAAEETARLEAERLAAEEAARLEAERLAAEEAARLEAERLAAEESARLAAEEAARAEAERAAAEEAARLEAERLAAEEAARLEAEHAAAEEAARLEAERLEAEEAQRLAAEEAARAEAAQPVDTLEVASLFRDINDVGMPVHEEEVPEDEPEPARPVEPPVPAGPVGQERAANGSRAGLSETAALLRELTSLGLDDEPEPSSPARAAAQSAQRPPSPPAKEQPKKRKGLFGRG